MTIRQPRVTRYMQTLVWQYVTGVVLRLQAQDLAL